SRRCSARLCRGDPPKGQGEGARATVAVKAAAEGGPIAVVVGDGDEGGEGGEDAETWLVVPDTHEGHPRRKRKERPHASSMSHESSKESDEAAEAELDEDEGAPERPEGGVAIAAPTAPHQANRHIELQSSVEVGGALTGKASGNVKLYTEGERGKAGRGYAGTKLGR
ncbi:Protein of unknown function, partial [Gryllus bimaculatus]